MCDCSTAVGISSAIFRNSSLVISCTSQPDYFFLWPTISPRTVRRSTRVRFFSVAGVSNEMCGISQRCSAMNQIGFSVVIQLRSPNRVRFSGLSERALSPTNSRRGQGPVSRKSGARRRRQMTILLLRYASPLRSAAPINSSRPALWDQGRRHIVEQLGKYCLARVGVTVRVMVLS